MLAKTIKYVDYDGNTREETFRFNLSKAEVAELEFSTPGGLERHIKSMVADGDGKVIVEFFKMLILKAYGEKSDDGRRFIKSTELSRAFSQTEAYSELFMDLASNAEAGTLFINGIIPQN